MEAAVAIDRARLLISQNRFEMAQELLGQALAVEPDNAQAHSWLALCLAENRDRLKEATHEAEQGVFLAPDDPFTHYVLASVWENRNQIDNAIAAVDEAIRLDPTHALFHGLKARLLSQKGNWRGALDSAEEGLTFDPEDDACNALRSLSLERLGRVSDAQAQAEESLRQNPDSTWAHSSHGWAMLQQGDYQAAQKSFAEALRLSPNNEMARSGMIQALNSANFFYRWFYLLMTKIGRMSSQTQWMLIVGLWVGMQVLNNAARKMPALEPWVLPISLFYLLFVMMSWIMTPLFNTMLRFHKYGRHLLSDNERWASNLIAGTLVISGLLALAIGLTQHDWYDFVFPILTGIFLTIPIVIPFNCDAPRVKMIAAAIAAVFGVLFLAINIPLLFGQFSAGIYQFYLFGILIYCFLGQGLMKVENKQ